MQDMKYVEFDQTRPMDLILLGRVAIDFNPAYNDQVKEEFKPLKDVHTFEKFVGGSPANIAVGVTRHGLKAGFLGKVSDDQFGDYVTEYFDKQGIDTSHITRCTNGEKLGLTFTEMLSEKESHILMYRNCIADLQLHVDDIDEDYIKQSKAILISGTALAESPSREAAIKAVMLAKKNNTKETTKKNTTKKKKNFVHLEVIDLIHVEFSLLLKKMHLILKEKILRNQKDKIYMELLL